MSASRPPSPASGEDDASAEDDEEAAVSSTTGISFKLHKSEHETSKEDAIQPQLDRKKHRRDIKKIVDHRVVEPIILQRIGENEYRVKPREEYGRGTRLSQKRKFSPQPASADTTKCNFCVCTFETVSEMRTHMTESHFQRSTGIKLCDGCSSLFQTANSNIQESRVLPSLPEKVLLMDLETPDSNICVICNEVFKSVSGMRLHRTKIHIMKEKRIIQCICCSATFQTIQLFTLHKDECPGVLEDITGIVEGNTAPCFSVPTEQMDTKKLRSSTPSLSRKANKKQDLAEEAHNISIPSAPTLAPDSKQHLPKKRRRQLPKQSSPEREPEERAPHVGNSLQEQPVKEVSPSISVPDILRSLLMSKRDNRTVNSYCQLNESFVPQHKQVAEELPVPNGGNCKANDPSRSDHCYKRKQRDQELQNGSNGIKKKKDKEKQRVIPTATATAISATTESRFPLKGCCVVLTDIRPIEGQCSLPDSEEQTEEVSPTGMEAPSSNRGGQDTNCNKNALASLSDTKSGSYSTENQSEEGTSNIDDRQSSAENIVRQLSVEGEEANVRDSFPQNKCADISKQTTVDNLSVQAALYMRGSVTDSHSSSGNSTASFMNGTGVERIEDSNSQTSTDKGDLHTLVDPITRTENKNTLQRINRKADISTPADDIISTGDAKDNYRNKEFIGDRIKKSSPDNESLTTVATVGDGEPLEGCNSDDSFQYPHSGTNSNVQNLSVCDGPSCAEMLHTSDTLTNSEVGPNGTESFVDATIQSASNHSPPVSHPSTEHCNSTVTEHQETDPCIGSPAECDTDTDRQIFTDTFFDETESPDMAFTLDSSEKQNYFSPSPSISDTDDISCILSSKRVRKQKHEVNHFSYNEETGFHSTNNEASISLGTLQQEQTSEDSFFPGGERETVSDGETNCEFEQIWETKTEEISVLFFDDDCITETSQSTFDEEETYLRNIVKETINQIKKKCSSLQSELSSDSEFSSHQELEKLWTILSSPNTDCKAKTVSSPEFEQVDEALAFTFHSDNNGETIINQRSMSSKSQLLNTSKIMNSDIRLSEIDLISSTVLKDGNEVPSNAGSNQVASNTDNVQEELMEEMIKLITDGAEESYSPNNNKISDWLAESTDTETYISSDKSQTVEYSILENSLEALSNTGTISNLATDSTPEYPLLTNCQISNWPSNGGSNQVASNTDNIQKDLTEDVSKLITDGAEKSYSPNNNNVSDWLGESIDTGIFISSDESQAVEYSILENSSEALSNTGTISNLATDSTSESPLLADCQISNWPSNGGSNQVASNTDNIQEDLTEDMIKLITDGAEESYSPNNNNVSDWLGESIDTEIFISSDESQTMEYTILEKGSEALNNTGTISNPATDSTSESPLLTDCQIPDWSPVCNNSSPFPDPPLNLYIGHSSDCDEDLTFDWPVDKHDCGTVEDELLGELLQLNFPSLTECDFAKRSSADEATIYTENTDFETLNFDLLVASPPDYSDWFTTPETEAAKEEIETDSHRNPGPCTMDRNEVLIREEGSIIPSQTDNVETVNGIGCPTQNGHVITNNKAAESVPSEIADETSGELANCTGCSIGSTEVDDNDNNSSTRRDPDATEIVSEGTESASAATRSPSVTHSKIASTETVQYEKEVETNAPNRDTVKSAADNLLISLTDSIPSCSISQYQEESDGASYCVISEGIANTAHCEKAPSGNNITSKAEKGTMTEQINLSKRTSETEQGIPTYGNITEQNNQLNINEALQMTVPPGGLLYKTQSIVANPALADQVLKLFQATNSNPSSLKVAIPKVTPQKDRQETTANAAVRNVLLLDAGSNSILKTRQLLENSVIVYSAQNCQPTSGNLQMICAGANLWIPVNGQIVTDQFKVREQEVEASLYTTAEKSMTVKESQTICTVSDDDDCIILEDESFPANRNTELNKSSKTCSPTTTNSNSKNTNKITHKINDMRSLNLTSKANRGTDCSGIDEIIIDDKSLTTEKYNEVVIPEKTILVNVVATPSIPVHKKSTVFTGNTVSLQELVGNSSMAVDPDCTLIGPTVTPQILTQGGQPITVWSSNGATRPIQIVNPSFRREVAHKNDVLTARERQHNDTEVVVITKSSDTAKNPPPEWRLARTPEIEVQFVTCQDAERIQGKGAMAQRGNLTATSNGKPNEILQAEEVLALSLTPTKVAEGTSHSKSTDLSHTSTEESQREESAVSNISQMGSKTQFCTRNATQRNSPTQTSQEVVLVQCANLMQVHPTATVDGTNVRGTTAVNTESKQGDNYMWTILNQQKRVFPAGNTAATGSLGSDTTRDSHVCHCGRRFKNLRGLHQHQSRYHFQTVLVHKESTEKCDKLLHLLPNKRYECLCGSIYRSLPAVFDHYRRCHKGRGDEFSWQSHNKLQICSCKNFKPHSEQSIPSSLHKQTDMEAEP